MSVNTETTTPSAVSVTPAALRFIKRMVRFGGAGPRAGFRLEVSPGGCSGMSAAFSVEAEPKQGDQVVVLEGGERLYLPQASFALLAGVTIDFLESATESKFTFIDPKAGNCGCGSGAGSASLPS